MTKCLFSRLKHADRFHQKEPPSVIAYDSLVSNSLDNDTLAYRPIGV